MVSIGGELNGRGDGVVVHKDFFFFFGGGGKGGKCVYAP